MGVKGGREVGGRIVVFQRGLLQSRRNLEFTAGSGEGANCVFHS